MKPSIGRIVHYTSTRFVDNIEVEFVCAGIIVYTYDENSTNADLRLFKRDRDETVLDVPFSLTKQKACWNWPPRE